MSWDPPDPVRVLHVDDDPDFAELTATFLERESDRLTVETADDVDEALERLRAGAYDCVVSDYDMPGRNGIEFLETVRETDPSLPFVLFTGKGSEEVASDAISAGVTDYLQKEAGTDQYAVLANRIVNAVGHDRSQRLVERSERRLREIVDSLPHFLFVVDRGGTYLLANETLAAFHDTTVDEIEGATVDEVLGAEAAERVRGDVEEVLRTGEPKRVTDVELPDAAGRTRVLEPRLLPYDLTDGDEGAVLGIAVDVTEREQRKHELERARERMQLALDRTQSVVFEIDLDTGDVVRHGAYEQFFDHRPAEVPTWEDHCETVVHPEDRAAFRRFHRELIDGDRERGEIEYRTTPDPETGGHRWLRATVDTDGAPDRRAVGISRDITAYKEREAELERKERRYRAVFEDPNILVGLLDTDGTVLDINRTALAYVDADRADVVGRRFSRTPWFDEGGNTASRIEEWIGRAAAGEYVEFDLELTGPNGNPYSITGVFRPVTDDDGEVVSIIISTRETSERKRNRRALERTNTLLSALVDTLPVGVLAEDENRNVLKTNEQLFDLFGMQGTPAEAVGEDCERLAEAVSAMFEDSEGFVDGIEAAVTGDDDARDESLTLRDGRTFARNYRRIGLPDGDGHLWVYRDVTESARRERRLEALNETTRELMAAETRERIAEVGVETARDILGLDANSVHLLDDEAGLVPIAYTDALGEIIGEPPTFAAGESIAWRSYERGEAFAVDDVHDDPDVYDSDSTLRSELYLPLGEDGILIAGSTTAGAFDQRDLVLGKILASSLTTALEQVYRREQLRARERELARRNDHLESFASVLSHDLRSPLNVATGQLELLAEDCDSERLPPVRRSLERMETLIEDLLTLAREGTEVGEMEPIDLATLVRTCWETVETDAATLDVRTDGKIVADRSRLRQLIENLIRNSVEHGSTSSRPKADDSVEHGSTSSRPKADDSVEHGSTSSRTQSGDREGSPIPREADDSEPHDATVTVTVGDCEGGFYVADDGPGIPEADHEAVFEAGYSTSHDGTGLGLRIVEGIATAHGWSVSVTEGADGGARFEITGVEHTSKTPVD
ncbi:PAS domain S-box protein [Haloplanus rallus]|uniref:histidine kinase n=1 Tax=Haloplanus rallus TaxID=1816183 RepID=A0A6B9F5T1_9EURY|nr:PAS domain-containing protein [Haloplanus rallus]QGX94762.1 PAS domain S-box protein [Haloplanus rallus]